ncbi:MAG: 4Fe-4S binding protein [Nitrospirae bacterium]|nr:4Fe-4S binding protein [Nitrospirota bacterium]
MCDGCGLCAPDCPMDMICPNGNKFEIGIGCNMCGACGSVCPVGAIKKS